MVCEGSGGGAREGRRCWVERAENLRRKFARTSFAASSAACARRPTSARASVPRPRKSDAFGTACRAVDGCSLAVRGPAADSDAIASSSSAGMPASSGSE